MTLATTMTTRRTRAFVASAEPRRSRATVTTIRPRATDDDRDESPPLTEASLADVVAKLERAEADRERLRAELDAKRSGEASVKSVDELARMKPSTRGKPRVDGVGKREQLFASRSEGDAWLRDGMEFLVRDQPSEAGASEAGMTEEEEATVRRRAIVGFVMTAAFVGLSQI